MNKFINPFSDYGWKKIFGSEVSKDLIISVLNEVIQQEVIVDITFRNVEMLGLKQDQRRAVFDIFCENEKGEVFICEMQKSRQKYFSDRVLYYASFAIQQQSMIVKEKLEKELARKEKALAEAAALLVLRKKADAIWGTDEWLNPRQEAETKKETKVS